MELSGSVPIITCNFNFEHYVRQLTEIFICLDKNLKPFHCPTPSFTLCTGAPIIFPAFNPSYNNNNNNPTHKCQPPRIPGGKPRNFYKPGVKLAASNHLVAFKPAMPLTAMCMDPAAQSTFLHDEEGHFVECMDCPFDNASRSLNPPRILVPWWKFTDLMKELAKFKSVACKCRKKWRQKWKNSAAIFCFALHFSLSYPLYSNLSPA